MEKKKTTNNNISINKINKISAIKDKFSKIKKEYGYLALAAIIPALIFFLIYLVRGIYPFGDETVLVLDLNGQYVGFFEGLRNALLEGGSLLYSWSRALGGEFLGIYSYYIASPLSYLVCLFPQDRIQEFLLVLFMIKAALCGFSMGFYLHKHSENKNKLTVIAFSILYAVSAYCVVQQSNTMWIDAVMWLPLVAFGIEELVKFGRYKCFVIFLALTLASNFYIGYMVCIFVLLYYFFFMIAYKDNNANNPRNEKHHFVKSFVRMGFFSALSIAICAVIVLSAYYSLQFGKSSFTDPSWEIKMRFDFFDFLFKLLPSSYDTVRIDGLPFVYCGLLTVILAPMFFCSKKFTAREKIASGVFLAIFVFSFMISSLDLIWHGFQKPQWLNNRYSFMFCFFLIFLAFRAFDAIEEISAKSLACVSGFIFFFVVLLQQFREQFSQKLFDLTYGPNEEDFVVHQFATILMTIVLLIAYISIVAAMKTAKNPQKVSAVLVSVVCIEVFLSGLCNVIDFDKDVGFTNHSKYSEFIGLYRPVANTVLDADPTFYRMEKTHLRKDNDNMALMIRGLTNSTSTLNKETIAFLKSMGYYSQSHRSKYLGGNPVSDALLGVKYIITQRDYSDLYGEPAFTGEDYAVHEGITLEELIENTFSDYYSDWSSDDINVYLNPYALSLAFPADDAVLDVNFKEHNNNVKDDDERYNPDGFTSPFTRLNALITAILGEDETVEVFKPAIQNGEPKLSGATASSSSKHYKYTGENGKITYNYTVPEGVMLYLYFPSFYSREIDISSSTMKIFDSTSNLAKCNDRIVELGYTKDTEYSLTVKIANTRNEFYTKQDEAFIYYVDTAALAEAFGRIHEKQLAIDENYRDDDIKGKITTDKENQLIFTTIPYDEGWKVYVDGERVDIEKAADALIAFRIDSEGEHSIRFKYAPITYVGGLAITLSAITAFALIIVFEKKLKKVKAVKTIFAVEQQSVEEQSAEQ